MSSASDSEAKSEVPRYPNPPLQYPKFKLGELDDPPPNWKYLGDTAEDVIRTRKFRRQDLDRIMEFHCWGIDLGVPARLTNIRLIRALWKLFYYQADYHRPQSIRELFITDKDAGPRLLSCSIDSTSLLPISRFYPHPPNASGMTGPDYIRPPNAAASIPDTYVERMLIPRAGLPTGNTAASTSGSPPDQNVVTPGDYGNDGGSQQTNLNIANVGPAGAGNSTANTSFNVTSFIPIPSVVQPLRSSMRLPTHKAREVIEAIERTVMKFAYSDLDRDLTAVPRIPRPYLTALTEEDISKAVIGSFPANCQVRLVQDPDNERQSIDRTGYLYPCRGRGPMWRHNSGVIDCIIVVGKLLDAGSTVIDRKENGWQNRFTELERAFIKATDINWDGCSKDASKALRDRFWELLSQQITGVQIGQLGPLWAVWAKSASNFAQFQFSYREAVAQCQCTGTAPSRHTYHRSCLNPTVYPEDQNGVTMNEVIARSFAPRQVVDCSVCNRKDSVICERRIDALPLRLVVTLDERVSIRNHTQDITLDYCDRDGGQQRATYRWLGGIYFNEYHYRVYWTDTERGEVDSGYLRVYDSTMNLGLIIGNIPPAHRDDRVPPAWCRDKHVPFLIYERVMNPEPEVLNIASHTILDMVGIHLENKPILQQHTPWTQSEPSAYSHQLYWDQILPNKGNRFYTAAAAYSPKVQDSQFTDQYSGIQNAIAQTPQTRALPVTPTQRSTGLSPAVQAMQYSPHLLAMDPTVFMGAPNEYIPQPFGFGSSRNWELNSGGITNKNNNPYLSAPGLPQTIDPQVMQLSDSLLQGQSLFDTPAQAQAQQSPSQRYSTSPESSQSSLAQMMPFAQSGYRPAVPVDPVDRSSKRRTEDGDYGGNGEAMEFNPKRGVEEVDNDTDDGGNGKAVEPKTKKARTIPRRSTRVTRATTKA